MSKPRLNLVGQRFGKLLAISKVEPPAGRTLFVCVCDCGATSTVVASDLKSGNTTSCGCVKKTTGLTSNLKHGGAAGKLSGAYRSWRSMKQRCTDPNCINWSQYGALGVTVCNRWLAYENFYEDMGDRPDGYSLERIDVTKGYSPENCKWIPLADQCKNKRNTVRYKVDGEILIQAEVARRLSLHPATVCEMRRQRRLPSGVEALTA